MTVDERSRHQLYLKLEEVLGPEEATVLMEHPPPVGWADVATKRDLDALALATKRDLEQLEARNHIEHQRSEQALKASFRAEIIAQTRIMIFALVSAVVAATGLGVAGRLL